ncbi:uncharacterized protein isoform X2 [Rhodnius prolixus]
MVLRIPQAVKAGGNLQIVCDYDLEGAQLYSIKFYQGEEEFYRFVPKESPPTRVFPRPGIQVDIYLSNSTVVTLRNVQKELTGFYGCEVSADAPLFHTGIMSAPVIVTEEPASLPDLSVEKGKYSLGEKIRANCTSQGGYPPANLTWYINGKEVKEWVGTIVVEVPGMSEVEFEARSSLFRDGKLRLRCLATQFTLYRQSAEIDLQEDIPQLAHVMGPTPPAHTNEVNSGMNMKTSLPLILIILLTEVSPR